MATTANQIIDKTTTSNGSSTVYAERKEHEAKVTRLVRTVTDVENPFFVVKTDNGKELILSASKCVGKTPKRGDIIFYQNMKAGDVVRGGNGEDYTYPEDKVRVVGIDVASEEDIRVSVKMRLAAILEGLDD